MDDVRGMSMLTPRSAAIFVTGMFAVTALPPFGPFFSELRSVARGARFRARSIGAAAMFLGCLLLAFFGMTPRGVRRSWTDARARATRTNRQTFCRNAGVIAPPLAAAGPVIVAGTFHSADIARSLVGGGRTTFSNSMSAFTPFALLANATSLPWAEVPGGP